MRQVLANLLDNAIKYTPTGGRVDLAAYAERAEPVIAAEDDGIAISPADLPRVGSEGRSKPQRPGEGA